MGDTTKIEWCDMTFNPWIGCTKVSEGCQHCYAESLNQRWSQGANWGKGAPRRRTRPENWKQPIMWDKQAKKEGTRPRVFCASLADVFDQEVPWEWRQDLFQLINDTPNLDWLLLTKRPEHIAQSMMMISNGNFGFTWNFLLHMPNVWLGTSAENQDRWNERVPILMDIPATVHFVSAEPLLGPIDVCHSLRIPDWIIIGGESGPKCRPMHQSWAQRLIGSIEQHRWESKPKYQGMRRTSIFVKQMGGHPNKRGHLEDIPKPLRIREFPNTLPA